jgi:hypothetical protein
LPELLAEVFVLVALRFEAAVVREEPFLLAPPRWEVFATQLPFGPISGHLDLREPARKLLADKRVEDSHSVDISLPSEGPVNCRKLR